MVISDFIHELEKMMQKKGDRNLVLRVTEKNTVPKLVFDERTNTVFMLEKGEDK